MAAPDWFGELITLAELLRANGVLNDFADMTDDERYGVLVYLRRLATERDA